MGLDTILIIVAFVGVASFVMGACAALGWGFGADLWDAIR